MLFRTGLNPSWIWFERFVVTESLALCYRLARSAVVMPPKRQTRSRIGNSGKDEEKPTEDKRASEDGESKRSSPKKKAKIEIEFENDEDPGENVPSTWQPPNWEVVLNNIRKMRMSNDAPVDKMGCDKCHHEDDPPEVQRYHILVSLMLSSQTKDEVNHAAMGRLREYGLTIDNILENTTDEVLGKLIYPVGFWKRKVGYIKRTTQILKNEYDGDIPNTVENLCKLPGVGPKMAHICMNVAWGVVSGIGVDTHVHRIANRLNWVRKTTKTPEMTRKGLESWLPKDLWKEVNHLLVGFGQTQCRPVGPKCSTCLNRTICPASTAKK